MNEAEPLYDVVIVGAGSAGAVIASRVSENPNRSVLLLDAGPDYPRLEETPYDLVNAYHNSVEDHDWQHQYRPTAEFPLTPFPRGRVTGGSSAVNTAIALRGVKLTSRASAAPRSTSAGASYCTTSRTHSPLLSTARRSPGPRRHPRSHASRYLHWEQDVDRYANHIEAARQPPGCAVCSRRSPSPSSPSAPRSRS